MCVALGVSPGIVSPPKIPRRVPPPTAAAHGGGGRRFVVPGLTLGYTHVVPPGLCVPCPHGILKS